MSRYLPASETGIYSENLLTIVTNGRTRLEKVWSGRTSLKKVWSEVLFLIGTQKFSYAHDKTENIILSF